MSRFLPAANRSSADWKHAAQPAAKSCSIRSWAGHGYEDIAGRTAALPLALTPCALRAANGQQTMGTAPLNHASRSRTARKAA